MVSADIVPSATSGEHLLEDTRVSKVETVVEDAFDFPDEIEESRNPSQDRVNRATLRELDDGTRKSEETSSPNNQQQRTRWWRFRRAPVAEPNSERQDLGTERTPQEEDSSSSQQEGSHSETAIVVRSESVNVLWGLMSRAARRNTLWRAASRVQESSKGAAEQRARQGAALRHGVRKWIRRRNADDQESAGSETEQQVTGTRQSWWRRFRRNRSQVDQSSVNVETSTAIVPYGTGPHPIATVMKKAAVGVTGTCMVIVGVPLLLFPVPGPGVAMIASGVYVVSTEFEFARSWLETVKTRFGGVFDRLGIEVATPEALPSSKGPSPPLLASPPSLTPADEVEQEIEDSYDDEDTVEFEKDEDVNQEVMVA